MYESVVPNIMVKSVRDTLKFYEEKLGFQKVLSVPEQGEEFDFIILQKDSVTIMFQEQENLIQEYPTLKTERIMPTFTLFITVKDVKKLYKELKEKVEFAKDLHQTFYGRDEFAIFDNNGNILTIAG